jgi:predicted enzyme related to lactoylglutathione lyase
MKKTEYEHGVPSWVDLATPDMKASKAFYDGLFGWEGQTTEDPAAGGYTMFTLNGENVAGGAPLMSPDQPPAWTTYISVDDADQVAEAVAANGGKVVFPPMDVMDVGRMAVFADPSGAAFAVWQPRAHKGADIVNEPGALCWNELLTRDPAGAKSFYPAAFGWDSRTSPFGDVEYTEWLVGERSVGGLMEMTDENFPPDMPSHWMVYFAVADCDASVGRVSELGGTVVVEPTTIPVGRFAVCRDPHGASFSIIALNELPGG